MYIDDDMVAGAMCEEAGAKFQLALLVTQLCGWNIQWDRMVTEPAQSLLYLGFITDTKVMRYSTPVEKLEVLAGQMRILLRQCENGVPVGAKEVVAVMGKVASLQRSHG